MAIAGMRIPACVQARPVRMPGARPRRPSRRIGPGSPGCHLLSGCARAGPGPASRRPHPSRPPRLPPGCGRRARPEPCRCHIGPVRSVPMSH